ncbi:hypothetical protein Ddye_007619 [Dipteronia dyeriana]|uniref:BED-type domain-containing protein n=1 Tax=Dipteronia dyeriana TaxID=168575 RepID=A0AAD9XKR4_9ROSI|nr:hypothetical protein Ddye_007619 [Dipteronia dyeriana]
MPPSSDEFDAYEEEKPLKSNLFRVHMKKIELDDGTIKIMCNYCPEIYNAPKSFGYGTYWNHVKRNHPSELVKASNQGQISRVTLTRALFSIYKKKTEIDIWTDNFGSHHYMGVTCHYIDNNWNMQKRIIAFRVFDESHTAHNIFRHLKIIFEEFHIQNKIFAIDFDNAASNTASIPMLKELCNPYFGEPRSYDLRASSSSSSNSHSELDRYLEANHVFLEDKFTIQGWWKDYEQDISNFGCYCQINSWNTGFYRCCGTRI